jgi:MerR family transcriptional regulator, heat shock protein HspR
MLLDKKKEVKRKKAYFSISAVAKMFSVHQQTIRLYEKQGLITPKRSDGNTRLFSEGDVDRLEEIIYLTHQLGINLAGVEMILKLKGQIKKMQKEMNKVFDQTQQELDKESHAAKEIIQSSAKRILKLKQASQGTSEPTLEKDLIESVNNWEIDYHEE